VPKTSILQRYIPLPRLLKISMSVACPCCGFDSLNERGGFEICSICWWEDDDQDNDDADTIRGGPNYHLSLTRARINFLLTGISDPEREDLRSKQASTESFKQSRVFVIGADKTSVSEPAVGWESSLQAEQELD
jgi:hypothetical protein